MILQKEDLFCVVPIDLEGAGGLMMVKLLVINKKIIIVKKMGFISGRILKEISVLRTARCPLMDIPLLILVHTSTSPDAGIHVPKQQGRRLPTPPFYYQAECASGDETRSIYAPKNWHTAAFMRIIYGCFFRYFVQDTPQGDDR